MRASRSYDVRALSVSSPPTIIGGARTYIPASSDPTPPRCVVTRVSPYAFARLTGG
ncbi:hypothetical protein [Nonomuraea jabiensis]|uniref:hypothetical protein n=1 Tax=Nonomuraea jabiensis TaxID=882448 RepID=UPI003D72F534